MSGRAGFAAIRSVVVGVGFIGVAHVEALRRLGVDVVGVVGSDPERAAKKAFAANLPPVYGSLDEALADERVDVIHIATPNALHAPQARAAIAAGKHVICEKPLALTADDADDMLARANAAGIVHAVCFNIRHYPLCHQARAIVASGDIGEPRLISGAYLQDWLLLSTDWNWRLVPEQGGSLRAVADIGSHWLDLVQFVTGQRIVEVMADLHTTVPVRRHPAGPVETFAQASADAELVAERMTTDDAAGILLRFEGGARGVVTISQVSAGRRNSLSFEVDGSSGSVAWRSEEPDSLWIGHRGRPNEILPRDPALAEEAARRQMAYPAGHVEGYPDTFRALFAEVYADVARGRPADRPSYPTFADGLDALRVTDAIARSAREGRWVAVDRSAASARTPTGVATEAHR